MTITGDIFPTYTDLTQQLTLFDPRNVTDQAPGLSPENLLVHPKLSQTNPRELDKVEAVPELTQIKDQFVLFCKV